MANQNLSRYIYYKGRDFAGQLLSHEALGVNGMLSTGEMLHYISKGQYQPTIEDIINSFMQNLEGRKKVDKEIDGDWYRWGIKTEVYPNALIKTVVSPTSGNVGENGSTFTICIDRPILKEKDIARVNSERQLYVLSNAIPVGSGSGYNYEVRLINDDDYLPPTDYDGVDSRIVKLSNAYERGSYGNAWNYKSGMTKYRVPLQIFRKSVDIVGDSLTVEAYKVCYDKATNSKIWWVEDLENAMKEFDMEINNAILFGKTSVRPDGTTSLKNKDGKDVYTFDGIYEQVAKANYNGVPSFSIETLTDFIQSIITITKESGTYNMKFIALCGIKAFMKIQKAAGKELNQISAVYQSDLFVRKTPYKGDVLGIKPFNTLEIGWNFTTIKLLGTEINFVHCPYFDNAILNPDIDPATGFPRKSNEVLLLNMSDFDTDIPNIVMLYRAGNGVSRKTVVNYVDGMHSFYNKSKTTLTGAASSFDGASMNMLAHRGVVVHYPYTCGILAINEPSVWY